MGEPTLTSGEALSPPDQIVQSSPAVVPLPSMQPAMNPLAIIGLVLAILLPPVGIVVCWIASYQIGQSKGWETGQEFTRIGYLAGLAVSVMWLFVWC